MPPPATITLIARSRGAAPDHRSERNVDGEDRGRPARFAAGDRFADAVPAGAVFVFREKHEL